ncbi:rhodanese domain-containing protein CG4456-like isoform X2 [Oratosquilla oratoria]|uniref:rhodanese domain-containing protein CG4456-like isoform X2 n=1 Tax=Oratosquilla oratoria TaxID=337810 RepID=UPI003F759D7C
MSEIQFEELKENLGNLTVVDVRSSGEIAKLGCIPGSVNIPLTEIEEAINLDGEDFKDKYGIDKPEGSCPHIVTHCMKGGRAQKAYDALAAAGVEDHRVYMGSFNDWVANGGEVSKTE